MSKNLSTGAKCLRELLKEQDKIIICPGVYDGLTTRIALSEGFEALYMTGAGTSLSRLGWADIGLATLPEMTANADMIANLDTSVPLIADADTGYGGPVMVARTVTSYSRAGVAALHIEDQIHEKRSGSMKRKPVVEREIWYTRLRAAINAREKVKSEIMIIARTDSRQSLGFNEAIERLKGAVDLGVDMVMLEGMQTKAECQELCEIMRETDTPVMLNMVPGGGPDLTVEEAKSFGVKIVIFPTICASSVLDSVKQSLRALRQRQEEEMLEFAGVKELFGICGMGECLEIDRLAGGKAFDNL